LNKTALNAEKENLGTYARFLPSLKLKRDQLLVERARAARRLADTDRGLRELIGAVGEAIPMLANQGVDLGELARVRAVDMGRERVLGLDLPVLAVVDIAVADYGCLTTPHWVDAVAARLEKAMRLRLSLGVERERLAIVERALKKVNQRINLFEKVLIPQAQQNIKIIQIALSDAQKAAVVRAKLAKRKRLGRRMA
jgi:V/A-type H+-transporting ATPase subunit D